MEACPCWWAPPTGLAPFGRQCPPHVASAKVRLLAVLRPSNEMGARMVHPDKLDRGNALSAPWDDSPVPEAARLPVEDVPGVDISASDASLSVEEAYFDRGLARLLEDVTRRIKAGEIVDIDELATSHPAWSGPIRRLLPAVVDLAQIGKGQEDGGSRELQDVEAGARSATFGSSAKSAAAAWGSFTRPSRPRSVDGSH